MYQILNNNLLLVEDKLFGPQICKDYSILILEFIFWSLNLKERESIVDEYDFLQAETHISLRKDRFVESI